MMHSPVKRDEAPVPANRRENAMNLDNVNGSDAERLPMDLEISAWIDEDDYCLECDETDARELAAGSVRSLRQSD
jgi:hypothetical protein